MCPRLNRWFIAYKLSLNIVKTCYMNFSTKPFRSFLLHYHGLNVINEIDNCKYPSRIINNELEWTPHINFVYRDSQIL